MKDIPILFEWAEPGDLIDYKITSVRGPQFNFHNVLNYSVRMTADLVNPGEEFQVRLMLINHAAPVNVIIHTEELEVKRLTLDQYSGAGNIEKIGFGLYVIPMIAIFCRIFLGLPERMDGIPDCFF